MRYGTKAHMNQKNRQISNIEKPGRDNRTKPLPVGLMEFLYCVLLKGVIWVVSDCLVCFFKKTKKRACDVRRGAAGRFFSVSADLLQHTLNQWDKAKRQAFKAALLKVFVCACVCVCGKGTSG